MKKYICDKCEKEISLNESIYNSILIVDENRKINYGESMSNRVNTVRKKVELCKNCYDKLISFFEK